MRKRKKLALKKKRERDRAMKEALREQNTARKLRAAKFVELKVVPSRFIPRSGSLDYRTAPSCKYSVQDGVQTDSAPREELGAEMAGRERAARVVAEGRKKMVAPMWNKGTYQYIGDLPPELIETLGRKV